MKKKIRFLIITLIIIILVSLLSLKIINNKISPVVMDYSISEMKRLTSIIINRSINSDVLDKDDMDNLFVTKYNNDTVTITLDSIIINKITDNISDAVEDNLRLVEEGKYNELKSKFNIGEEYFFVPSGIIFKNSLFSSIGPRIPINLKVIGNVVSDIKTDVKEYGINNSLITISVDITVEMMVILPLTSKEIKINNQVPIVIKLIQGKIPEFYTGNILK